jgi:hypothetical protein
MPKRRANARARGAHAPLCRGTPSMRAAGDACMVRLKLQMLLQTREHDVDYAIMVVVRRGCMEGGGGGQQQGGGALATEPALLLLLLATHPISRHVRDATRPLESTETKTTLEPNLGFYN